MYFVCSQSEKTDRKGAQKSGFTVSRLKIKLVFWITDLFWLLVPCKEQKQHTRVSARTMAEGFVLPPPSPQRVYSSV